MTKATAGALKTVEMLTMTKLKKFCLVFVVVGLTASAAHADEVVNWNQTLFRAGLVAGTSPLVMTRVAAIVQAAVFDAVNGIDRRYAQIHVPAAGPAGASPEAAAVQAAYATLVQLYPAQKGLFDARLAVSLAVVATHASSVAVASGVAWGQSVADAILAWRSADGFTPAPPPFLGAAIVGTWRPTPPAFAPGAGPQFAYMVPWVIAAPSQFRPGGPPPLTSDRYAADFNETKNIGRFGERRAHSRPDGVLLVLEFDQREFLVEQRRGLVDRSDGRRRSRESP